MTRHQALKTLLKRLSEPSTYAAFAGLAITYGISMDKFNAWVGAIAAVAAFAGMVLAEKGTVESLPKPYENEEE